MALKFSLNENVSFATTAAFEATLITVGTTGAMCLILLPKFITIYQELKDGISDTGLSLFLESVSSSNADFASNVTSKNKRSGLVEKAAKLHQQMTNMKAKLKTSTDTVTKLKQDIKDNELELLNLTSEIEYLQDLQGHAPLILVSTVEVSVVPA